MAENGKENTGDLILGTYSNLTVADLYQGDVYKDMSKPLECAYYWVEAENVWLVRATVAKWFDWLNEDVANKHYPDTRGKMFTQERADAFVEALEDDMMREESRFSQLGKDAGPGFLRLEPHARVAFMQDVWLVMKTKEELWDEAGRRLGAGIKAPPKNWWTNKHKQPPLWWLAPDYKEDPDESDNDNIHTQPIIYSDF